MHQGKLVFAQVMAHLPLSTFRRCVARHGGEHKIKSFSCLDQFYAMAFAQLTFRESLRDIEACRYRTITWREGTNNPLISRFAAVRVRSAHRDYWRAELPPEQWLLIEWPRGEPEPTKYFLSTLPAPTSTKELVRLAKLRWRIERDYQELKQELGLGHFEGRSWRGFHHHATLCIAAYAFLPTQRLAAPKNTLSHPVLGEIPALPTDFRPRGSPAPAAPRPRLDHDAAPGTRRGTDRPARSVSVLRQKT